MTDEKLEVYIPHIHVSQITLRSHSQKSDNTLHHKISRLGGEGLLQ